MTKKETLDMLVAAGLVERVTYDPENGFYGAQTYAEVTPAGLGRVVLARFPRSGDDCWAGEVVPLSYISLDGERLWTRE